MEHTERYIVCVEPAPTGEDEQAPLAMKMSSYASFYEAFVALTSHPADTYHVDNATQYGFGQYIHEATITDAQTGTTLVAVARLAKELSAEVGFAVFLELDPQVMKNFFAELNPNKDEEQVNKRILFPMMFEDLEHNFLYPTPDLVALQHYSFKKYFNEEQCINPNNWVVYAEALRMEHQDQHIAQATPLIIQHIVPTPEVGLRLLLQVSDFEFDLQAVRKMKHPILYDTISLQDEQKAKLHALTNVLELPTASDEYEAQRAGRYLTSPEGWSQALQLIGMHHIPEQIPAFDSTTIKIGYWNTADPPRLRPTYLGEQLQEHLQNTHDRVTEHMQYSANVVMKPISGADAPGNREQRHYHYTADLVEALNQVIGVDLTFFENADRKQTGRLLFTDHSDITTASGAQILQLSFHKGEDKGRKGVYLDILDVPAFADILQKTGLQKLLTDLSVGHPADGKSLSIQMARYSNDAIYPTPISRRMEYAITMEHVERQLRKEPSLRYPQSERIKSEDNYLLVLQWARMSDPDQTAALYQVGFADVKQAATALLSIVDDVFSAQTRKASLDQLFLQRASIWDHHQKVEMASKEAIHQGDSLQMMLKGTIHSDGELRAFIDDFMISSGVNATRVQGPRTPPKQSRNLMPQPSKSPRKGK